MDNKLPTFEWLMERLKQFDPSIEDHILCAYLWGSRVYGTATPSSDYDFNIIVSEEFRKEKRVTQREKINVDDIDKPFEIYDDDVINATFIPKDHWIMMVRTCKHEALECIMAPRHCVLLEKLTYDTQVDPDVLRRTVSVESKVRQRSWPQKFKQDKRTGLKYLFHSIRYRLFAIQIIERGSITDFSAANYLWDQISNENFSTIEQYDNKYKVVFNDARKKFKSLRKYRQFYGRTEAITKAYDTCRLQYIQKHKRNNETSLIHNTINVQEDSPFLILQLVQHHGLEYITKYFPHLRITKHSKHADTVLIVHEGHVTSTTNALEWQLGGGGILVDVSTSTPSVIGYSFPKFYHYCETQQPNDNVRATYLPKDTFIKDDFVTYEYLDGICNVILYHHHDEWHISAGIEADNPQFPVFFKTEMEDENEASNNNSVETIDFTTFFWKVFHGAGYQLPSDISKCYTFHVVAKDQRYLTNPGETDRLYLVGCFDLQAMKEVEFQEVATLNGWLFPPRYQLNTVEDVIHAAKNLNPFVQRGFILVDRNFCRLKVSNPYHVAQSYATDFYSVSWFNWRADVDTKHLLAIIRHNRDDVFCGYFPDLKPACSNLRQQYNEMCHDVVQTWNRILEASRASADPNKQFGLLSKGCWCSFLLFHLKKGFYQTPEEFFALSDPKEFFKAWNAWTSRSSNENK